MFGGAFGLLFSKRYDDEHWMSARPDMERWNQLKQEMDERKDYGDFLESPHRRKDDSDVHPLIRYGVKVGIPSVMASLLVYWLVMKLDTKLDASLEMARTHSIMTTSMAEQGHRTERLLERAVALMSAQCFNAAKTPAERSECRDASR